MDTDDLSSSLSLALFLVGFSYLGLAQAMSAGQSAPTEPTSRGLRALRVLRIAAVVAAALSFQVLLLGKTSPAIGVHAAAALGFLVFIVLLDGAAGITSRRFPSAAGAMASPLLGLLRIPIGRRPQAAGNGVEGAGEEVGDTEGDPDSTTVVITEEGPATLDDRERLMIRSILRLDESTAKEVMVPRVDIVAVDAGTSLSAVASTMQEHGHSRIPVYTGTTDNIIGVVHSRDLLPFLSRMEEHPSLAEVTRPPFFTPESKRLDDLLREMQEKHVHMAMVVDEYGGVEGLVTLEDLLEEIVGEIEDEFSLGMEPRVVPMANGDIIADARVRLEYLSDLLSSPLPQEDVDTVGGLVYASLGKMPEVGDSVTHDGLRIEVISLLGRRIRKLKLSRTQG